MSKTMETVAVVELSSEDESPPPRKRPSRRTSKSPPARADASRHASPEASEQGEEWEVGSLILELTGDPDDTDDSGPDVCTKEESLYYRQLLHDVGIEQFIFETLSSERISARKLCTAFGMSSKYFALFDESPMTYFRILRRQLIEEYGKRQKLPEYNTIDDAAGLLKEAKNVVVITGAGISTSLGIPDFRSKDTGFYSKLREMGFDDPQEVFDIHRFDEDPHTFYSLAGDILPTMKQHSPTHHFIKLLQDKNKLLTNYTQNIDNVEQHAGIQDDKLIQCHGSWKTATCRKCKNTVPGKEIFEGLRSGSIVYCKACTERIRAAAAKPQRRKRERGGAPKPRKWRKNTYGDDDDEEEDDVEEPGVMKPDITFFGEQLPDNFFNRFEDKDVKLADLVIVIGTSMKVKPVSEMPDIFNRDVPIIYISRDPCEHINFDITLLGDCDVVVAELCRRAGWELKHEMVPPRLEVNVDAVEGHEGRYSVVRNL